MHAGQSYLIIDDSKCKSIFLCLGPEYIQEKLLQEKIGEVRV